jgi:hypothetical protein
VLTLLKAQSFFVLLSKCAFAKTLLEYLGHIISRQGVATDPKKTQVMLDWPIPVGVIELRRFLGLTRYYHKFVKDYGLLANPLTTLLKKKQFLWSPEAHSAFDSLKKAMASTLVLALPDFEKQFIAETDACDGGIGAVLMQEDKPIAFLSGPLSASNKFLSAYEKEFLALIMVVEKWRPYMQRQEFLIRIDQKSLAYLMSRCCSLKCKGKE